ncbi:DUF6602 domain-containing protein [Sorangium sp. So ce119]|uniref:DUF6602 domain-containing protein n=1 Tax=Sorangium sp. So ce119 TaxID=3133279 RepID=UPI003F621563
MTSNPADLAQLQRNRLRAQADLFAAVASHGTIVGTAREIALTEFFRGLVPRRFEILSGAIALTEGGKLQKASNQLDVLVVDTLDYPTVLRTGDLAITLAPSVRVVVESKSDLARGDKFLDAMEQIGQARSLTGGGALSALYCFGDPTNASTLRTWIDDLLTRRRELVNWARDAEATRQKKFKSWTPAQLLTVAATYSAANLPDVIVADSGAIALRVDENGKTRFEFYSPLDGAPSIVALAAKVLAHVSQHVVSAAAPAGQTGGATGAFQLLVTHFEASLEKADVDPLDVTDPQPSLGG